jgi:hypothetical protein
VKSASVRNSWLKLLANDVLSNGCFRELILKIAIRIPPVWPPRAHKVDIYTLTFYTWPSICRSHRYEEAGRQV